MASDNESAIPDGMTAKAAETIATKAHLGQFDKAGLPYITHPSRVASRVAASHGLSDPAVAVAWLHDVVEDTAVSLEELTALGLSDAQRAALSALTHLSGESRLEYLERVAASEIATRVKFADIADNSDPARLGLLDESVAARLRAKYAADVEFLRSRLS